MKKILLFILAAVMVFGAVACGEETPENATYDSINIANDELEGIKRFWHDNVIKVTMDRYCAFFADEFPVDTLLDYIRFPGSKHTFYLLKSNSNEFSCVRKYVDINEEIHKEDFELSNEVYNFYYKYALSPELVFGNDVEVTAVYCFSGEKAPAGYTCHPDELDIYYVTSEGDYVLSLFRSNIYLLSADEYKQIAIKCNNDKEIYCGGFPQLLAYADDLTKYVFEEPGR